MYDFNLMRLTSFNFYQLFLVFASFFTMFRRFLKRFDHVLTRWETRGHNWANTAHRWAINGLLLFMAYNICTILAGYNETMREIRVIKQ